MGGFENLSPVSEYDLTHFIECSIVYTGVFSHYRSDSTEAYVAVYDLPTLRVRLVIEVSCKRKHLSASTVEPCANTGMHMRMFTQTHVYYLLSAKREWSLNLGAIFTKIGK